jgi:two-component system, OmpR family, sensor kinase
LLRVGETFEDLNADRKQLFELMLLLIPLATGVSAITGWWIAARALRPLYELKAAADQISISQLEHRLPVRRTGDEMELVTKSFNEAFARVETGVQQMKTFSAWMAHELRTPLTVLRGEAEITLMQPALPQPIRELLYSQLEEFDKLARMIQRFLLLARGEAGNIEFEKREFDLSALVALLGHELAPIAMSKGITLQWESDTSVRVAADEGWMERAILNLLDNAMNFTPEGGSICLSVRAMNREAVVEVSDTGAGIPDAELPQIFEPFYRGRDARPVHPRGVGLGLSLTKWIIEKHGGEIQVKSVVSKGSVFTIVLPLAAETVCPALVDGPSLSTAD